MLLTEHRSSPSTVQFTVSSSSSPSSTTALPNLSTLLDAVTSLLQSLLLLLFGQWAALHLDTNRILGPILRYLRHLLPYSDVQIVHVNDKSWDLTPLGAMSILCLSLFLFFSKSTPIEESFLVIRSLGIQTTTKMRFPLSTHSRFIPASQIDDVFIHEGFKGFQVRHYLAVVVHGEEQLEVVFPKLLPRREVLEHVWRSTREVLFKVDGQQLPNGKTE